MSAAVLTKMTAEGMQSTFPQVSVRDQLMAVLSKTQQPERHRSEDDFSSVPVRAISLSFQDVQNNIVNYLFVIQTHGMEAKHWEERT